MDRQDRVKHWLIAGGCALAVLLIAGLVWVIHGFMSENQQKPQRVIQNITILRPPPPPPDQPPPPPPPKVEQQPLQQKEPDPTPDQTPQPSPQLGLDATGTAGGDSFGLVARQGGADLIGTGGAAFAWYTGKIKDAVSDRVAADPKLHAKKFIVNVRLWIEADGRIKEVRISTSSGSRDIDGEISAVLGSMGQLNEGPPIEMPQPVTVEIVGHS
jgi:periplasmic protein TonB